MRAQKGFTLIELVVVIAILGVLAAITVPRINNFLLQATEVSYTADLAIIQSAVSAWYSDLHNDQFLGSRQYPIIGRNETSQEGRIVRGEEGVENVDAVGPFDHKDDGSPLAPTDAAGPDWNPLGGAQGADLLHVGEDGTPAWNDDGDGFRERGEDTWSTVEVSHLGNTYFVDSRYYFLDMQALVDAGWLPSIPASSSKDNSPTGTGSYTFYIDQNGKVQTLFFHFPVIQGFVEDIQGPGEPFPTPIIPSNTRPTASITSPSSGSTFPSSGSITFNGSGSDAEDGQLSGNSLVWTSSINGQIGIGAPLNLSLSVGSHTITLTAKDSLGATGSASIEITVTTPTPFNSRPVASIAAPTSNLVFLTTDSITFTGSAFDAQDGPLGGDSLVWTSNIDGQIGSGNSFSASLSAESHLITLIATDSQGELDAATVSVTVNEAPQNNPPTASINNPDDIFTYSTTDTITFAGTGSDAEDGVLTGPSLVWSSSLTGQIGTGTSISVSLGVGSHIISLTATDSQGATDSATITITVISPGGVDVTFQKGDGKGAVSETDDANLESDHDDDNFGARRSLNVDGRPHKHVVLKFPDIFGNDANQIPLGSTINSAALTLTVSNSTDRDPTVYRIIESWTESEVTWSSRSDDVEWSNDGADGTGSHAATPVGDFPMRRSGSQSMDVTTSLRSWSNGEINEGWVLIDNSNNGADFDSGETRKTGERPKLTVNYTPP